MAHKQPVKDHLRNAALYQPMAAPAYSADWKRRLFIQSSMQKQLNDVLYSKASILKLPACIVVPIVCLVLVFASYFGFLPMGQWFENIISKSALDLPTIGLNEVLVFAAVINGLTFLVMKRKLSF